jgi:hypothetical protein
MNIKNARLAVLIVAAGAAWAPSSAHADEWNKLTSLTFSQPVAVPGVVLSAGTYTFRLADSLSDGHVVQILNQAGTRLLATILTIPDSRLTPTDDTVVTFGERSGDAPLAIRSWFYPGHTLGQAFIYPKPRQATATR